MDDQLEAARRDISEIAATFTQQAAQRLREVMSRRVDALVERRLSAGTIAGDQAASLRSAAGKGVEQGVAAVERRLADIELWLSPRTILVESSSEPGGWGIGVPEWLASIVRRIGMRRLPGLGDLDDPNNRIWIAILNAADPLDPILEGSGFPPS